MFKKRNVPLTGSVKEDKPEKSPNVHTGVRPSIINSKPCISSGSRTLDQLLGHGGIPLGSILLLLEHGSTDFASSIIKAFGAYGVEEQRQKQNTRVIVIGVPDYLASLPGVLGPEESNKRKNTQPHAGPKMKIAWRYQASPESGTKHSKYAPDLNYKSAMIPRPRDSEIEYIVGRTLTDIIGALRGYLDENAGSVFRIVVPSVLHPAVYPPSSALPRELVPFYFCLRSLVREHKAACIVSLPLQLFPRLHPNTGEMETLSDSVLEIEPFPSDKVQGFVHVHKIADLSARGVMISRVQEYAFKLGRHQFEVEDWAIPVEESGAKDDKELF